MLYVKAKNVFLNVIIFSNNCNWKYPVLRLNYFMKTVKKI